jgi:hypothetical protein
MIAVLPHMHLRGKDFRMDIQFADGRTLTPLVVPRYDFNWQIFYDFAEPIRVAKGSVVHMISHYDNSANNPANPDPTKRVRWGKQTEDEMQTVLVVCQQPFNRPLQTDTVLPSDQPRPPPQKEQDSNRFGDTASSWHPVRAKQAQKEQDSNLFRVSAMWIGVVGIPAAVGIALNRLRRKAKQNDEPSATGN